MSYYSRGGSRGSSRGGRGSSRGGGGGGGGNGGGPARKPRLPFALQDELGLDSRRDREREKRKWGGGGGEDERYRNDVRGGRPDRGGAEVVDRGSTRGRGGFKSRPTAANVKSDLESISTETLLAELQSRPSTSASVAAISKLSNSSKVAPSAEADTPPTKKRKRSSIADSLPASLLASSSSSSGLKRRKTKQELEEDKEIAWLEYQLGKKGKNGSKGKKSASTRGDGEEGVDGMDGMELDEDDDGLDDLLGFVDTLGAGTVDSNEEEEDEGESEENDEEDRRENEDVDSESEDDNLADFYSDDEDTDDETRQNTLRNATSLPRPENTQDPGSEEQDEEDEELHQPNKGVKASDAYGAAGSASSLALQSQSTSSINTPTKYIPPALRALQAQHQLNGQGEQAKKTEAKIKLERNLQGLLNKMGESNLEMILGEIEGVYRENARNDVTSTITDLVIASIADKANLLETFVVLYASLIAALYKVVGVEFGAYFLQALVTQYSSLSHLHLTTHIETSSSDAAKQPLNMLTLLCEMYNFQVVGCKLVYDLIRGFIEGINVGEESGREVEGEEVGEFAVEGLLKIMRCSGPQLRSDDPTALKDILQLVQQKTSGHESSLSPRSKFMIETLVNIKNHKTRTSPGGQMGAEATLRMKKFLSGLSKKRTILTYEPLRVSLQDILSADTKGKWWLVGAGWSGNPLVDRQEALSTAAAAKEKGKKKTHTGNVDNNDNDNLDSLGVQDGEALLKLARKQGMNTDIRRSVFVILMTSDDFMHATDRLSQLKLTELQEREFVRVALHCCSIEPTYNPYYALFLNHICTASYSHRFTLQYAIWDLLRDLGEKDVGGNQISEGGGRAAGSMAFGGEDGKRKGKELRNRVGNLGRAVGWVVANGGADLTVFKPLDFTSIVAKSTYLFLDTFFTHLVLSSYTAVPSFKLPQSILSSNLIPKAREKLSIGDDKVQEVFEKALTRVDVAQGIAYHLATRFTGKKAVGAGLADGMVKMVGGEEVMVVVLRGLKVAQDVLKRAS